LILPPTFASPTSATWWLWQNKTEIKTPAIKNYSVTYDNAPQTDFVPQTIPLPAPLPPKLNVAGCLLLASIFISAILFSWLAIRWWQISRKIRGAVESGKFSDALAGARLLANSNSCARLKIVEAQMSPAVCGLFRPVILLPRALAEKLSAEQLCAVLLHEVFHLRRKDVWVNCAQALLQIFYWWHPLLWFANARIRRVREEAVDDAVMLALRDEAETYAPTLLEVAKLALRRPLMSLGLVGIMESRSALRQRIERLLNFRAPKKAGLTFASLCGIFIFSAVALPMGEGPISANENQIASAPVVGIVSATSAKPNPKTVMVTAKFYWLSADNFENLKTRLDFLNGQTTNSVWSLSPNQFNELPKELNLLGVAAMSSPRLGMIDGESGEIKISNGTNGIELRCTAFVENNSIKLIIAGETFDKTKFPATNNFCANTVAENSGGILIRQKNSDFSESNLLVMVGAQIYTSFPVQTDSQNSNVVSSNTISLTFEIEKPISLKNLTNLLIEGGVKIPPTIFFYKDNGILFTHGIPEQEKLVYQIVLKLNGFSPQNIEASTKSFLKDYASTSSAISTNLYMRTFRINADIKSELIKQTGLQNSDLSIMAREFFGRLGISWDIPKGKAIFYNDGLNLLFVKTTESDLDLIERALHLLNKDVPQVHIKARFLEVPKGTLDDFIKTIGSTNKISGELTGILTPQNFKTVFQNLESRPNVEILAEPEVVTTSGRQTQMRATQVVTVVTNFTFQDFWTNQDGVLVTNGMVAQTSKVETGPVLDVVPYVLSDGYTINLTLIPSVTEFLGYDKSTNTTATYDQSGEKIDEPTISPRFLVRQSAMTVNLFDNQTAVIGGLPGKKYVNGKEVFDQSKPSDKEILVFVTATIVDPAGNRVHSDNEMPIATNGIPPADSSVNLYNSP
jgi:beta-lactamase regulating signal transducer with metallopeptidase domain